MPTLAMELRHLAQADRFLREGYLRVKRMEENIARAVSLRLNVDQACDLITLTRDNLVICEKLRVHILDAIEHLDGNPSVRFSIKEGSQDETGILKRELVKAFSGIHPNA